MRSKAAHEVRASDSLLYRMTVRSQLQAITSFCRVERRQRQCIRGAVAVLVALVELTVVREEYVFWQKRYVNMVTAS